MIERLSLADWQLFDAVHRAPTFFARPGWALALADAFETLTPAPLRVRAESGKPVIVPLMQRTGGRLRWKEYVAPYGGYTCVLDESGATASPADSASALETIARYADHLTAIPYPLAPGPRLPAAERIEHETAVIDLDGGAEAALGRLAGISRRMAGQAMRRGVTCAPSTENDAVDAYYAMLESSARRWGAQSPHIPRALLEAVLRHGGSDAEIWFARHEGQRIAGGVVFYGREEFFFWSAAMLHEFGRLRPSNALNVALIEAAATRGMRWYNLGSSEGLPGVARFKRDLGASDVSYAEYRFSRAAFSTYTALRRRIVRSAPL